jgi:hypothetical protein
MAQAIVSIWRLILTPNFLSFLSYLATLNKNQNYVRGSFFLIPVTLNETIQQ